MTPAVNPKRTLLGVGAYAPKAEPPSTGTQALGRTVQGIGLEPGAAPQSDLGRTAHGLGPTPEPAAGALKSTVHGLGPGSAAANPLGRTARIEPSGNPAAPGNALGRTARIEPPASPTPHEQALGRTARIEPPDRPAAAPERRPSEAKTLLGVARPGIAPLNPSAQKASPQPAASPSPAAARRAPAPEPDASIGPPRRRWPRALGLALAISAVLAGLVTLVLLLLPSERVQASVVGDPSGGERLAVRCDDCPDGMLIRRGEREAKLQDGVAELPLSEPLGIGEHRIELELIEPGASSKRVTLVVPVRYRVRADLAGLNEQPPKLRVVAQGQQGLRIEVDGQPLALDGSGKGSVDLPVGDALEGTSPDVERFERSVPYRVTTKTGAVEDGQVLLQLGIAPLVVDVPRGQVVTEADELMVVGQTRPDAELYIDERRAPVDSQGKFAQVVKLPAAGEHTIWVRATAPKMAPRRVPVHATRVPSLRDHAAGLRKTMAASRYPDLSAATAGDLVRLQGRVVEARSDPYSTAALVEAADGCPREPCLVRVVHFEKRNLKPGEPIEVFGRVTGQVAGPRSGHTIPELTADFLLQGKE